MLYYIIKNTNGSHWTKKVENATDSTYHELKQRLGYNVVGTFGRSDYAQYWEDFHNGKITREQLTEKLNSVRK